MTQGTRPLVFLGPSLPETAARRILPEAEYRPPARRGDLDAVDRAAFDEVLLIDGVMVYDHPPSPSEVYRLMQRRVRVVGAASLGALRAVELRKHGMEGVGWVVENYGSGLVTADDELVARLDPRTGRAVTLFLINLRYAAVCLTEAGVLAAEQADRFLTAMAAVHFEQRTGAETRRLASAAGIAPEAADQLMEARFDVKALDAARALAGSRHASPLAAGLAEVGQQ
ncbi:TfuA-like protein [Dactylosporangium sp. NPDC051485]|uniref:TfuA-like protein n=1 Tax=Dactylosporangium sp. NPDC051485 TaxID=3154846 RepID=UPI00342C4185